MAKVDLKTKREGRGLTLAAVFERTRIAVKYLEAIEEGNFGLLPPAVYARQFIRTYARFLDEDPEGVLAEYERYWVCEQAAPPVIPPPPKKTGLLKGIIPLVPRKYVLPLLFVLVALLVVYGFFRADAGLYQRVTSWLAVTSPSEEAREEKVPEPVLPEKPLASGERQIDPPLPYHLVINARELTWLRIRADRDPPSQVLLNPGERVERFARERLVLDIGNAGGIELVFQGQNLGAPGKSGEVIHMKLP